MLIHALYFFCIGDFSLRREIFYGIDANLEDNVTPQTSVTGKVLD
jgi:hypothetical protein